MHSMSKLLSNIKSAPFLLLLLQIEMYPLDPDLFQLTSDSYDCWNAGGIFCVKTISTILLLAFYPLARS